MIKKIIGIIDYQAGNISSLKNSITELGFKAELIRNSNNIKNFDKIILPGVGSFEIAIKNLRLNKIDIELKNFLKDKKNKLLGICLGMQLLFESSEESLDDKKKVLGLAFLKGQVKNFSKSKRLMNIGWNNLYESKKSYLTKNIEKDKKIFYFVHGYYCKSVNKKYILSYSYFNNSKFLSAIENDNIYGVQFHPEKSLSSGLKLLNNFCNL